MPSLRRPDREFKRTTQQAIDHRVESDHGPDSVPRRVSSPPSSRKGNSAPPKYVDPYEFAMVSDTDPSADDRLVDANVGVSSAIDSPGQY